MKITDRAITIVYYINPNEIETILDDVYTHAIECHCRPLTGHQKNVCGQPVGMKCMCV